MADMWLLVSGMLGIYYILKYQQAKIKRHKEEIKEYRFKAALFLMIMFLIGTFFQ